MKARAQFWELLKNELDLGRSGGTGTLLIVLATYWGCVGAFPSIILFRNGGQFADGLLFVVGLWFLSVLTLWMNYATNPAFSNLLSPGGAVPGAIQYFGAFEFLFTRPVDRKTLYRARTAALFLFTLAPLILNLAASPLAPEINFGLAASARQQEYLTAFPMSHPPKGPFGGQLAPLIVVPHGAVAFTEWLAWSGALAFVLLQAYTALTARCVRSGRWWSALFAIGPIFFAIVFCIVAARISPRNHQSISEQSFLFFSTHSLGMVGALAIVAAIVQGWCERRFSKLEIV